MKDGSGLENAQKTKGLFDQAMADCGQIMLEMHDVANGLEEVQSRPDREEIFLNLYEQHKNELARFMQDQFKAWQVGKFFEAGVNAGSVESLILSQFDTQSESFL